jgi:hypothetical protein
LVLLLSRKKGKKEIIQPGIHPEKLADGLYRIRTCIKGTH